MTVKKIEADGLKFYVRENTSDAKTIDEVVIRNTYQSRGIKIERGDNWIDMGGNIGVLLNR